MTEKASLAGLPWFVSTDEELWHEGGATRDAAIALGRQENPKEGFWVAQGVFRSPWTTLFAQAGDLGEYIDDSNEENAYEDGFCDEAGVGNADLEGLTTQINDLWAAFVAEHNLQSRRLDVFNSERIPELEAASVPAE